MIAPADLPQPPQTPQPPAQMVVGAKLDARVATAGKLVAEWYPRINVLLFDPPHPLPVAPPRVLVDQKPIYDGVPAYADGHDIHLWAAYVQDQDQADFEGMVIHELTHINQNHQQYDDAAVWVVEGIADYIRHKYFARDIEATLRVGPDGFLQGYPPQDIFLYALQQQKTDLSVRGYLQRYTVASAFLYWLEQRKDSRIVHELSRALEQGTYTPALFEQTCGKPLDALWDEFFAESKRAGQARTAGVPAR
jgi:hypothetical protein